MNNFQRLKNWLKGFFKVEYTCELREEPVVDPCKIFNSTDREMDQFFELIGDFPLKNLSFGLKTYKVEKIRNSSDIKKEIERSNHCISFTKVCTESFSLVNRRELEVVHTLFAIGLDDKVWKIQLQTYMTYTCGTREFDNHLAYALGQFAEICLNGLQLQKIMKSRLEVNDIFQTDLLACRRFDGTISVFGNHDESIIYGIKNELPDVENNIARLIQNSVHNKPVTKIQEDDSLIYNVVKANTPKHMSEEFKAEMRKFNIDVISAATVGEISDAANEIILEDKENET